MTKTYWVIFLKDEATGVISGCAYAHNAVADYKKNPYYVGCQVIEVDMENLNYGKPPNKSEDKDDGNKAR